MFFKKSYWAMKYLALWYPGLQNVFCKISKTLRLPSYIFNVDSLTIYQILVPKNDIQCHSELFFSFKIKLIVSTDIRN